VFGAREMAAGDLVGSAVIPAPASSPPLGPKNGSVMARGCRGRHGGGDRYGGRSPMMCGGGELCMAPAEALDG
jgi:hypothetical protein